MLLSYEAAIIAAAFRKATFAASEKPKNPLLVQ
jgi:hypothetical protein